MKHPEFRKRFNLKTGQWENIPFKLDPEEVQSDIEAEEDEIKASQKNPDPDPIYQTRMDNYGREVIDPRPIQVEVKELTQEQKIWNQFVAANNKAALEFENLPEAWDFSTPEAAAKTLEDILEMPPGS